MARIDMASIEAHQQRLSAIVGDSPIIPVVTVRDPEQGVALARALWESGLRAVEVTLRTPGALASLAAIKAALPDVVLGAGTVLDDTQMQAAARAGCDFSVSPGATDRVVDASLDADLPLLPGAASASETQALLERGIALQKFFPAEPSGGLAYLNAICGPYPGVRFCPTGGINAGNAAHYLATANVACVGGSWMAPAASIEAQDWARVRALAAAAAATAAAARPIG